MALMGLHYFHEVPQLGRSQGCHLIELDEWTATWTKQVDPPLSPPGPLLTQTHTCTRTDAHTLHPQRRVCTAARWNMAKRRPIILQTDDSGCGRPAHFSCRRSKPCCCRLLTTGLFSSPLLCLGWGKDFGRYVLLWDYLKLKWWC